MAFAPAALISLFTTGSLAMASAGFATSLVAFLVCAASFGGKSSAFRAAPGSSNQLAATNANVNLRIITLNLSQPSPPVATLVAALQPRF
jgi:hypothetical protein